MADERLTSHAVLTTKHGTAQKIDISATVLEFAQVNTPEVLFWTVAVHNAAQQNYYSFYF